MGTLLSYAARIQLLALSEFPISIGKSFSGADLYPHFHFQITVEPPRLIFFLSVWSPCGWRTGETCRSNTILHLTHGLFFLFQSRLQTDLAQAISCTVGSCSLRTRYQLNVDEKTFANTASGSANPNVTRSAAHSVKAGNVTTR